MIIKVDKKTELGLLRLAESLDLSIEELIMFILGSPDVVCEFSGSPDKREVLHTLPFKQPHTNQVFLNQQGLKS